MSSPNKIIQLFLREHEPDTTRMVAKAAKTSVPYLRHVAAGRRGITCEMAERLAQATKQFTGITRLKRGDLCATCGADSQ